MATPGPCTWALQRDAVSPIAYGGQHFWPSVAEGDDGRLLISGLHRGADEVARIHVHSLDSDGHWEEELAVPGSRGTLGRDANGRVHLLVMGIDANLHDGVDRTWHSVLGSAAFLRAHGVWSDPKHLGDYYFAGRIAPSSDGLEAVLVPIEEDGQWHIGRAGAWEPVPAAHTGTADALYPQLTHTESDAALFWYDEGGAQPTIAHGDGPPWIGERAVGAQIGFMDGVPALVDYAEAGLTITTPDGVRRPMQTAAGALRDQMQGDTSACDESADTCAFDHRTVHHTLLDLVPTTHSALAVVLRQTRVATQLRRSCIHGEYRAQCSWQPIDPVVSSTLLIGPLGQPLAEVPLSDPMASRPEAFESEAVLVDNRLHIVGLQALKPPPTGVDDLQIRALTLACR